MFLFDRENLTGIDIGSYAIKVVKIKKGRGMGRLSAVGYSRLSAMKLPEDSAMVSQVLQNLLRERGIKGKSIATAFAGGSLSQTHLYLPRMPKKDMKEAVRWEMRKQVAYPPEELVCDFATMGEAKRGDESMVSLVAFCARKADVEQFMKVFENALLEPAGVSVAPMAMLAAFDRNNLWESGVSYAMVDIGDAKATLAVFKDTKLRFTREIPIAGKELTMAVVQKLACSEEVAEREKIRCGLVQTTGGDESIVDALTGVAERLTAEVRRSFDFYQAEFREAGISKMFLCGGSARLKGIDDFFANALGIPSFIDDPLRNILMSPGKFEVARIREFAPDLTVAVGLAVSRYS